ncbi:hypothetical protein ACT3S2_11585 [Arthrobacter sp. AOP36-A1-22]|uniref:hypothetical protein n=1 Tax=Arthrobacter sp. AOP36-A1-22 TaxID=3457684 RepID=UPI004033BF77
MDGASSAARGGRTAAVLLALPLVLSACTGGDPGGPSEAGGSGSADPAPSSSSAAASPSSSEAPASSSALPPLTGPLPSFTADELADAAHELAENHPGARVRTAKEIAGQTETGQALLDDMDITPAQCAPFMDNQEATLPAGAVITSVTIPGDTVNRESYVSLASYPDPEAAAAAVSRTTDLVSRCGTFDLHLGDTDGTATVDREKTTTDAEATVGYRMDVAAGEQGVASYTVSGSDGAVVVSATTRDEQEEDIVPEDVAEQLDEALEALRTQ